LCLNSRIHGKKRIVGATQEEYFPSDGMNRYEFDLNISQDEFLDYYRGLARHVVVRSRGGQTVQFPASLLTRFVTPEGVHGRFVLTCDENHKHAQLQRGNADG